MNPEEILDEIQPISTLLQKHRPLAIILEALPILGIIIFLLLGNFPYLGYSYLALTSLYIFGGWYIFKADKYRVKDIVFVELTMILSITPLLSAFIYKILNWPNAKEIFYSSSVLTALFLFITCLWYYIHRNRPLEWRLSIKLLTRLLAFFAINTYLNNYF